MLSATTILAPEEIPRTNGPAIGFSKKVCKRKPDRDRAPPRIAAIRIRGRRIFQIILYSFPSPVRRSRIRKISGIEIFTFPELIFSTVMAANARISTRNTAAYRERRRKFSIWKLFSFPVIFFFSDIRSSIRIIFLRIPSDPDRRPLPEG